MAIARPIGKNTKIALFSKESTEGVYVAPSQAQHFVSESFKYAPVSIEDPSNVGKVYTTDLVKSGYSVEGSVEMKLHPYFAGNALFHAIGKEDAVSNPAQGFLLIWYKGSSKYMRIRKVGTDLIAEESADGSTWTGDDNFGTSGTLALSTLTLSQLASTINAYTDYKAVYLGYASSDNTGLADFSNQILTSEGIARGACICPFLAATGASAKTHRIYPDDSALTDIPSSSACVNRNFGTSRNVGLSGGKVSSLNIKLEPKNFVSLTVGMVFKEQDDDVSFTASDVPVSKAFTTNSSKVFIDAIGVDSSQEVKELTIGVNNNLYKDEAIGSETFISQGRQGATIELNGTVNLTVTDSTDEETALLQERMKNDVPVEVIVYMENQDYADSSLNAKYAILIRLRAVKLSEASAVVSGPDRITLPIAGKGVYSQYGPHIECWIVNRQLTTY